VGGLKKEKEKYISYGLQLQMTTSRQKRGVRRRGYNKTKEKEAFSRRWEFLWWMAT